MALFLTSICVIVGCLSVSLAGAANLSDLYPPLWEESPENFRAYFQQDGQHIIDAWNYPQRMGMYRILLKETAKYFERFAPDNEQNLLWGLPLQHGWQYSSGRLADPTHATDCGSASGDKSCISVDSWWADFVHLQIPSTSFGDLLKYLWAAHTSTLEHVSPLFDK
ncbi:PREDICTED: UPF0762 protein C6orf58 homolog, partial [Elephantulus edwardii]|uniref:UPF0762 protein C6orf58 homolog n=1 Tax=Elephantulus edwardii TaxID=28737 RepID=UPI0003F0E9F2